MTGLTIRLLPQAEEDLDRIHEPLYSEVIDRLQLLKKYPNMGYPMDGPFEGYRATMVRFFRIVYRIASPTRIDIAYIRHGRRGFPLH